MVNTANTPKIFTTVLYTTSFTDYLGTPIASVCSCLRTGISTSTNASTSASTNTSTSSSIVLPSPTPLPVSNKCSRHPAPLNCPWDSARGPLPCDIFSILASALESDGEMYDINNCGTKYLGSPSGYVSFTTCLPWKLELWTGPNWCHADRDADHLSVQYHGQELNVPDSRMSGCLNTADYEFWCTLKLDAEEDGYLMNNQA